MPADGPFIAKLKQLVQEADYCGKTINREEVLKKLHEFRDLYVDSSFSMDVAIAAKAAVLVFRGASNAVAGYLGCRETPMHVDHGRTVAYLPPCQQKAFKIWVFFRAMKDARSIRVGKTENSMNRVLGASSKTLDEEKWVAIAGNVVILKQDRLFAHRYAMQAAVAVAKGTRPAWERVLPAFCAMEGRVWRPNSFEAEKSKFIAKVEEDPKFAARRNATTAGIKKKENRKRKRHTQ
ncbi:hypothetical protein PHYSODRAFT_315400 [Phytophthora sojae]|uniref:Uncharacterized protein n=1 Tax=Phytophthora sojae (strain P6497) TaxID=1094619 RepID=G4ZJV4_PHYSP|nr:hypothetical protein PHYSODRAFT_315400 [Phytophthora sojae]EGZ18915.1 hypothetical protein PHYSODRAFT_315400 [Phytophthora sojae]|eukprot:XP_009527973.1 hypothetical protein PHYSODRAFT_315400 [Phytophthora sojae]